MIPTAGPDPQRKTPAPATPTPSASARPGTFLSAAEANNALGNPVPAANDINYIRVKSGGLAAIAPVVITIAIIAQWYYARRMTAAGAVY